MAIFSIRPSLSHSLVHRRTDTRALLPPYSSLRAFSSSSLFLSFTLCFVTFVALPFVAYGIGLIPASPFLFLLSLPRMRCNHRVRDADGLFFSYIRTSSRILLRIRDVSSIVNISSRESPRSKIVRLDRTSRIKSPWTSDFDFWSKNRSRVWKKKIRIEISSMTEGLHRK